MYSFYKIKTELVVNLLHPLTTLESISLSDEEKNFIGTHINANVQQLVLGHNAANTLNIRKMAVQISARQRLCDKLPAWVANPNIIFPSTVPTEQSSSEKTARYKARIVSNFRPAPAQLLDLTGGMGVDTWALASVADRVTYVERDSELAGLAAHNLPRLGLPNVTVLNAQSDTVLANLDPPADWIYLDPARRDNRGGRIVRLDDCEPNVVAWWPTLMANTTNLLLKASPLIDIEATLRALPGILAVYVVAVQHEVKEVLFIAGKDPVSTDDVQVIAIDLTTTGEVEFRFRRGDERTVPVGFDTPRAFIYEPNAAIMKAGAFRVIGHRFGLTKLAPHSHLYTSDEQIAHFPGRMFRLEAICKPSRADLQQFVPGMKANLTVRNFPQSVDDLRKKLGLKEGGDVYILATTLQNGDKRLLVTRK